MSSSRTRLSTTAHVTALLAVMLATAAGFLMASGCAKSDDPVSANDATPPEEVTDLASAAVLPDAITLTWTAPADARGRRTGAYVYDVRRDTTEITEPSWDDATACAGAPVPAEPGLAETLVVRCLDRDATYYFAVKSADADSNWSGLSNCATGSTPAGLETVDQAQLGDDYGFGFEEESVRWQEFRPTLGNLTAVEIYVYRAGSPGDVIVDISDAEDDVLSTVTVPESSIALGWIWIHVDLPQAACTVPGTKYRIHVASSQDSPAPSDRYTWRGEVDSAYDSGCMTSVSTGWPTYDFTFKTIGYSVAE
jgi:hypothetical protein